MDRKIINDQFSGKIFGDIEVLQLYTLTDNRPNFKCVCKCGSKMEVYLDTLISGKTTACLKCINKIKETDILGQQFGLLKVVEFVGIVKTYISYRCICECGDTRIVSRHDLLNNKVKLCNTYKHLRLDAENRVGEDHNRLKIMKVVRKNNSTSYQ